MNVSLSRFAICFVFKIWWFVVVVLPAKFLAILQYKIILISIIIKCSVLVRVLEHSGDDNGAASESVVGVRTTQKFELGCPTPYNFVLPCDL